MTFALKLLFFVLLAGSVGWLVLKPLFAGLLTLQQYKRAGIALFVVTVISFLSFQPSVFILLLVIAALVISRYLGPGNDGKINAFMLLLLPLPPLHVVLGGVEGLSYIMLVDHARALSLALLTVPAIGLLFRQRKSGEPSMRSVDIAMLLIQLWSLALLSQSANLTTMARALAVSFCDVLIPYYVLTRTLRTRSQLREAAAYLMLGLLFVASVAVVETLMQRNLYAGLQWIYGMKWESTVDLKRGAFLRIDSAAPQPIILGFYMIFGMGLWTWLRGDVVRGKAANAVYLLLAFVLVSTWSRGPWVGAVLLAIALLMQRWMPPRAFGPAVIVALIAAAVVKAMGGDEAILSALASTSGGAEADLSTIIYRRDLFDATLALIKQSPWTGVPNFESGLESFRQGEGIIDIVNTYLAIMINSGVVGLVLFLVPYVIVVFKLLGARENERRESKAIVGSFALVFIALILALLFVIFTVSSIGIIPYLLGLGITLPVAWLTHVRHEAVASEERPNQQRTRADLTPGLLDSPAFMRR